MLGHYAGCCCKETYRTLIMHTIDSSVEYTYLCAFETEDPDSPACIIWRDGRDSSSPEGSCIGDPTQEDKDKWNSDREAWNDLLAKEGKDWPVSGAVLSGKGKCWGGVQEAIWPKGESWVMDSFGGWTFKATGDGTASNRMKLDDLKNTFIELFEDFFKDDPEEEVDKEIEFAFLMIVDNTGSIRLSEWESGAQTLEDFKDWVFTEYPNVRYTEKILSDYIQDGEDWLRHATEFYQEVIDTDGGEKPKL